MPVEAEQACTLYKLPPAATEADLEIGFATRGAQLVDCNGRRRLAVATAAAEHQLEAEWAALRDERARPWWKIWKR